MKINIFMASNTVCHIAFQKGCYQFIISVVFYVFILLCFYLLSHILVPYILVNYNMFARYINLLLYYRSTICFPFFILVSLLFNYISFEFKKIGSPHFLLCIFFLLL